VFVICETSSTVEHLLIRPLWTWASPCCGASERS